jgi:hypothetical protein
MNYSTAVMLINKNIRAVNVVFEPQQDDPNYNAQEQRGQPASYTFKTLDKDAKVGDLYIAPKDGRHRFTVVKVVAVDVDVDFDSNIQLKWLANKVDKESYEKIIAEEAVAIEKIKKSEHLHKRQELADKLIKHHDAEGGLQALAIAQRGEDTKKIA